MSRVKARPAPPKIETPGLQVQEVTEPILSAWLTYPGDVRAGFINPDGKERIVGGPEAYWVAHEGECETDDDGMIIKTRIRFRMVWHRGIAIKWVGDDRL